MFKILKKLKFALISIYIIIILVSVASYADLSLFKNKTYNLPKATQVSNDGIIDDNKISSKDNKYSYETKENSTNEDLASEEKKSSHYK